MRIAFMAANSIYKGCHFFFCLCQQVSKENVIHIGYPMIKEVLKISRIGYFPEGLLNWLEGISSDRASWMFGTPRP